MGVGQPPMSSTSDIAACPVLEGDVRLLQATKVPAGHQKLIGGKIDQTLNTELLLFTPNVSHEDLFLTDSAVAPGEDKFITLVAQNHSHTAVWLGKGMRLGTVIPVDLAPPIEDRGPDGEDPHGHTDAADSLPTVGWLDAT